MTDLPSLTIAGIAVLLCGLAFAAAAIAVRFSGLRWRMPPSAEVRLDRLAMLGFLVALTGFLLALLSAIDWTLLSAHWREMPPWSRAARIGAGVYVSGLMLWIATAVLARSGSRISRSLRRLGGGVIVAGLLLAFPFLLATYGQERGITADDLGAYWWALQLAAWGAIAIGSSIGAAAFCARLAKARRLVLSRLHHARMVAIAATLIGGGLLATLTSMAVWKWNHHGGIRFTVTDTRMAEAVSAPVQRHMAVTRDA